MRIPSGTTDQYIYLVAVDATDFTTRETGLSSFTVYRSRNGGVSAAMTTPTINETDSTNMPGVYELLLDEDMTIGSGNDSEEMVFHITHAGMAPVTRTIELYRPKITAGNTLDVTSTGAAGIDWGNVENASASVDLSATAINLCDTVTTNTDMRGTDSAYTGTPPTSAAIADAVLDEALSGHITAGTLGKAVADIETDATAILADTNEMQGDWADGGRLDLILDARASQASVDTVDSNVDAILVDTGTDIPARFDGIEGATFSTSTDSLEAIRNRGDAAWTTGAGGSPPQLLQSTTIATLASQTSFTLTAGSADDDAYNGAIVVVTDQSTSTQKAVGEVSDYTGSTKTVTLAADPAIFTMAVGDTIEVIASLGSGDSAATIRAEIDANSTQLAAIVADTNELQTDNIPGLIAALNDPTAAAIADAVWDELQSGHVTAGSFGEIATEIASILADTNELQTDDVPGLIAALNDLSAADILTTALTESYSTDGSAPTLSQAVFLMLQFLYERSTSGTTVTVKKLDGSTTAATLTLDVATTPTSITRAT